MISDYVVCVIEFEASSVPMELIYKLIEYTRNKLRRKIPRGSGTVVDCGSQVTSAAAVFRLKANCFCFCFFASCFFVLFFGL